MGFAEDQARLALQLSGNNAELAANLLGEGNGQVPEDLTRRVGPRQLRLTSADACKLLSIICETPNAVQLLLSGQTLDVRVSQFQFQLTLAQVDSWTTAVYRMDFATFVRTGGFQAHPPPQKVSGELMQASLDDAWRLQFGQLQPLDQANIQRIAEQTGFDISISSQLYMLADMSLGQAMVLAQRIIAY
jgi:hypothetical protein